MFYFYTVMIMLTLLYLAYSHHVIYCVVQGHKKVRESLQRSLKSEDEDGEAYNIIKKQFSTGERDTASDDQMKDKVKNLFSLNSNKSLRLKRYGSWIAYEDQATTTDSSDIYWYNHSSGQGQWEVPESVVPLIGKSGTLKTKSSSKQMLVSFLTCVYVRRYLLMDQFFFCIC
jgi:hypothetical protein